ncbi:hypothetical protein BS50DRAFT_645203 [Corynespora cassiicola Philippines]|uniref:Uncharacterized protein n=1 Tax=Corynespora cassiicola Philippines TaxID=1448308 RepID=A0A2T2NIA0_CORCC|nr:hypothetical protein BS50DRAFT_645203 [Corynespora cassiicola Philippines]
MSSTTPTPQTWTLRLKSHKTTVLLHIDPLQTFSSIKATLHKALQETGGVHTLDPLTHESTALPLPSSPSDIQFGRPANPLEPSAGFQLGEWETSSPFGEDEDVAPVEDVKGKGKAKVGASKGKSAVAAAGDCPKGVGLRDGAVLAFRWRGDGLYEGEGDFDPEGGYVDGVDMWGVKMASFEDSYGVENEGDVGGRGEFEG